MLRNEVLNDPGQLMLLRKFYAILDVGTNNQGRHRGTELVMTIFMGILVLREVERLLYFPDIMKIGADPGNNWVGSNGIGCCLGNHAHDHGMVPGSWATVAQLFEQGMIQGGQFEQP